MAGLSVGLVRCRDSRLDVAVVRNDATSAATPSPASLPGLSHSGYGPAGAERQHGRGPGTAPTSPIQGADAPPPLALQPWRVNTAPSAANRLSIAGSTLPAICGPAGPGMRQGTPWRGRSFAVDVARRRGRRAFWRRPGGPGGRSARPGRSPERPRSVPLVAISETRRLWGAVSGEISVEILWKSAVFVKRADWPREQLVRNIWADAYDRITVGRRLGGVAGMASGRQCL